MAEADGTQYCFRCKGLAVINKRSLEKLPDILNQAAFFIQSLRQSDLEDAEEMRFLMEKLREYAVMIDGMPNGD